MQDEFEIVEKLEVELMEPNTLCDVERLDQTLADSFQEFDESGKVFTKKQIISLLRND